MAASTLFSATPSQLCSSKSRFFCNSQHILVNPNPSRALFFLGKDRGRMKVKFQATTIPKNKVPTMEERRLLNLILLGTLSVPIACMVIPFFAFLTPNSSGDSSDGIVAKDKLGNDIYLDQWLKTHKPGDRTLTQGFKGDPTYLIVENDGSLATYGINAVCTHLGCVVPWNVAEKKFNCPCHGSQYDPQGKVVRGPAPLSLALAHRDVDDGKVLFVPWVETDFRTGENPWWSS